METSESATSVPARGRGDRASIGKQCVPDGFMLDKETLKPGVGIFRPADVQHRQWYRRVKLPKAER